jgi:hypothetical protein
MKFHLAGINMNYLQWFAYPYRQLLEPWIDYLVPCVIGLSIALFFIDLYLPSGTNRNKGRLALILIPVNALLIQNQLLPDNHPAHVPLVALAAICLLVYGIGYRRVLRDEWMIFRETPPLRLGLIVIVLITAIKLVELESWPLFLNEYAGNTGIWGLSAFEGNWPGNPFQGRGFDLRGGGQSPLMLPVMWITMQQFGVNVWSVRFSEVVGSTVLLLFLWLWLRRTFPGKWSLAALIVFGLSPWHLAQSRMGTFFSISAAVAIGMLLSADGLNRAKTVPASTAWWLLFGFLAGCIGWSYAPMKVLYLFFLYVVIMVPVLNRHKQKRSWVGALCSVLVFSAVFTVQFQGLQHPKNMFQSHFGSLATDNPVWRKTIDDQVVNTIQPVSVITHNIYRNLIEWIRVTFTESDILRLYPGALIMSFVIAVLCLVCRWSFILPVYYFCGILPPLLIFPLHRRSLIIWPLVYVTAVVLLRETAVVGTRLGKRSYARKVVPLMVGFCLIPILLHGFHIWISTWSIVKDHSYFGPARRLEAIDFAADIAEDHSIVFLNPWVHEDVIKITLYETNHELGGNAIRYARINERTQNLHRYLDKHQPTAFIFFDLSHEPWLSAHIMRLLPGGVLQQYHNPGNRRELLYSVYTVYP